MLTVGGVNQAGAEVQSIIGTDTIYLQDVISIGLEESIAGPEASKEASQRISVLGVDGPHLSRVL